MIRAFSPWPGAYMQLRHNDSSSTKLKVIRAHTVSCETDHAPLTLFLTEHKELCLATKEKCLILETVQPEGKNPMSGHAFYLGHQTKIHS